MNFLFELNWKVFWREDINPSINARPGVIYLYRKSGRRFSWGWDAGSLSQLCKMIWQQHINLNLVVLPENVKIFVTKTKCARTSRRVCWILTSTASERDGISKVIAPFSSYSERSSCVFCSNNWKFVLVTYRRHG